MSARGTAGPIPRETASARSVNGSIKKGRGALLAPRPTATDQDYTCFYRQPPLIERRCKDGRSLSMSRHQAV